MTSSATGLPGHNPNIRYGLRDRCVWQSGHFRTYPDSPRDRNIGTFRKNPEIRPYQDIWYGRFFCAIRKNPEIRHNCHNQDDRPNPASP